ncbi:MAG: ATP-dependent DNA helicase [Clostridia bacterium]|nr:ATP-dependent DNA helicase [Clostridia bacterium]
MTQQKPLIPWRAAVRTVVEFSIHGEDLQIGGSQRMVEGGQAHRARQSFAREAVSDYQAEVALSITVRGEAVALEITGRADGLFARGDLWVVEEIKLASSGALGLADAWPEHWAQAACYGHMLCEARGYGAVCLRVLYVDAGGGEAACFERVVQSDKLARDFNALAAAYLAYVEERVAWRAARDAGLAALAFPYEEYRAGQRDFASNVYVAIRDRKRLLAQAPTGIGKTMAALFPALKALGEGLTGQVFYLTARTTGKQAALTALDRVRQAGVPLRALEMTAKEKCCPREGGMHCDPEACPYGKGYFLRIGDALEALRAQGGDWKSDTVRRLACAHTVCPFECSLALCELADVVVCDYNYAFDPGARLQSFFPQRRDLTLLIDEAHHLVDRARDMLSAALESGALRGLRKAWRAAYGAKNPLYRAATALIRAMDALRRDMGEEPEAWRTEAPLAEEARQFAQCAAEALADARGSLGQALLDPFWAAQVYCACAERYDDAYVTLIQRKGKELTVRLSCLDPAPYLDKSTTRLAGVVAFSATLSPLRGYARLLGMGVEADGLLALPSPFPPENLRVVGRKISTRWAHRADTAAEVAASVAAMANARAGNYLCMFPSYAYLRMVRELLEPLLPGVCLLTQSGGMDEAERAAFLAQFVPGERTMLGLVVMGGAFGEGIDLPGERLSGVAVVGIGLPQVGLERETLRAYYQRAMGDGFAYAYRYPGITRVQQAVGRVIRTARDVGVALLIDDRFFHSEVASLLPGHWQPIAPARNAEEIACLLQKFWGETQRRNGI